MSQPKKSRSRQVNEYQSQAYASDWYDRAACSGLDTNIFFGTGPYTDFEVYESHLICMGCPVMNECVASAVIRKDDQGLMGIPGINRQRMDLTSDVEKSISRAVIEFNNLEPQFSRTGRLISRRCTSCYRRVSKIPLNANDWGGRQSKCASCLVSNKKAGIRQSAAAPVYNEWGALTSKVCSKCHERKAATEYSKRDKGIGGLKSWCKACMVIYEKGWRKNKQRTVHVKLAIEIVKEQHER